MKLKSKQMVSINAIKPGRLLLGVLCMGMIVSACSSSSASPSAKSATGGKTVNIGVLLSTTGEAAFVGVPEQNAISLAISDVNKSHFLKNGDALVATNKNDNSSPAQSGTEMRAFVSNNKLLAILGPSISGPAAVTGPIAQSAGIPMIGISTNSGTVPQPGPYVFAQPVPAKQGGASLASIMVNKFHLTHVFAIYDSDQAGEAANALSVIKALKADGVTVTTNTSVSTNSDYAPQITNLISSHAGGLLMALNAPEAGTFMAQAARMGAPTLPTFGPPPTLSPELIKNGGTTTNGMIFPSDWNPTLSSKLNTSFVSQYVKAYHESPTDYAALGFSSVYLLATAMNNVSGPLTRAGIMQALSKLQNVPSILGSGTFSFAGDRNGNYNLVFLIIKNGKVIGDTSLAG